MDKTLLVASGSCLWNGTSNAVMEEWPLFPGSRVLVVFPAAPQRICLAFPASGLVTRVLGGLGETWKGFRFLSATEDLESLSLPKNQLCRSVTFPRGH